MEGGIENIRRNLVSGHPYPVVPEGSPLWPGQLVNLFFRPRIFFSNHLSSVMTPYVLFVTLCCGIAAAMGRLDSEMIRSNLGRPRPGWEDIAPMLTESCLAYWVFVLILGGISGFFLWMVGGWWYRIRLRWSGDPNPDKKKARLVYIYASFVSAGPMVLDSLMKTMAYANYQDAWNSDGLYSIALLIFPFWSLIASYIGAESVFEVSRTKARMWFIILPAIFYVMTFGLVTSLFYFLGFHGGVSGSLSL